jgi:hypothetical protein
MADRDVNFNDDYLDSNYVEVPCTKSVDGINFKTGIQDYNFSISKPNVWIPSKTFFRVGLKITGAAGGVPNNIEQLAFADGCGGSLWDNCYFRAGGQDVSSVTQYAPQSYMAKSRTRTPGAWLHSIGAQATMLEPDFQKRVNYTSADISPTFDASGSFVNLGLVLAVSVNNNVALSQANYEGVTVTLETNGDVSTPAGAPGTEGDLTKLKVGDTLTVLNIDYRVTVAATAAIGTDMKVTPAPAAQVLAVVDAFGITRHTPTEGKNQINVMVQPPLGIFDWEGELGAGDYRFQLNPNSDFEKAIVETLQPNAVIPGSYNVEVTNVRLYIATAKKNIGDKTEILDLMECQVQSKPSTGAGTNLLQFTVPPSTQMISVFTQSVSANTNPRLTPTSFKTKDNSQNNLQAVQITYNNTSKPSTKWSSKFTTTINELQHRYVESLNETGMYLNPAGAESFEDYMKRGPLVTYSFARDRESQATQVQLQMDYTALENDARIFIVAHYRRSTKITTSNGLVVAVESMMK